ncbi:hypothetical protein HGA91_00260 [candidate division WWE3 bacterium]|nr:hypothetical protein [candidate division WWE3 bacterium]
MSSPTDGSSLRRRRRLSPTRVGIAILAVLMLLTVIGLGIRTLLIRGNSSASTAPTSVSVTQVVPFGGGAPTVNPNNATAGSSQIQPTAAAAATPVNQAGTTSASGSLGTLKCFVANYPSYYPTILMAQQFAAKHNFELELVPMASGPNLDQNDFDENQQADYLRTGEFNCGLTTVDTFALQGAYGVNTLIISMSRGSDFMVSREPNQTLQGIIGKPIAAGANSVSELLTITFYYAGRENAADPNVRMMLPDINRAEQALEAYQAGQTNVMVGWIPVINLRDDGKTVFIYDGNGQDVDIGYKVIGSENLPSLIDGVIFSNQIVGENPALVQAFHDAWFDALNFMLSDPAGAATMISEWDQSHDGWTGIQALIDSGMSPDAAMRDYMNGIAQATLRSNVNLMNDQRTTQANGQRGVIATQIAFTSELWGYGGKPVQQFDPMTVVNPQFVLGTAERHPELLTDARALFTAKEFTLDRRPQVNPVDVTGIKPEDVVATFPREFFEFNANEGTLVEESVGRFDAYVDNSIKPALKATSVDVLMLCEVGTAWPPGDTAEGLMAFLTDVRIPAIRDLLSNRNVPVERIAFKPVIPSDPSHMNAADENIRRQDRFFGCQLVLPGAR